MGDVPGQVRDSFGVKVIGLDDLHGADRKVVFHGINKSGSLVMTRVLSESFRAAGRSEQFHSTYLGVGPEVLLERIDRRRRGFFGGHYLYGRFELRRGEHLLVTQFRNPLPRVRSCYQWLKNKRQATDPGSPFPPFETWVSSTGGIRHSQVEQLAVGFGPGAREKLSTAKGDDLLELAIENIERDVSWFGIAEYFEESAFCLAAICGLESIPGWQRDDRNQNRDLVQDWPPEHIDLVRDVYRWDFELYEWAVERFRTSIENLDFGDELCRYQHACRDQYKDRLDVRGSPLHDQ